MAATFSDLFTTMTSDMADPTTSAVTTTTMLPTNLSVGLVENSFIDRDESLARIEIATLAVIFFVTVLGNGTVLLALWTRKRYAGRKKLSRMYFFILHLSIADLITAFLSVLPQLGWEVTYRFNGGIILCKLVKFGQTLGPYLSSYVLMATAIDRHQAICYPLTYCSWTSRRSKVMVWIAWAASLIFCIPQLTIFAYQEVAPGVEDCWATFSQPWGERAYVTWYSISIFIIPLIVLIVTYSCICHEIWHSAVGELGMRPRQYMPSTLGANNSFGPPTTASNLSALPGVAEAITSGGSNGNAKFIATSDKPLISTSPAAQYYQHPHPNGTTPIGSLNTVTTALTGTSAQSTPAHYQPPYPQPHPQYYHQRRYAAITRSSKPIKIKGGGRKTAVGKNGAAKRTPLISRAKINTVKQTIAVIVMYILCSTPFISAQLWATWDPEAYQSPFLDGPVFTILTLLYSLNSCVNPWIYLAFNRELPRLLLRHYTTKRKNYRAAAGNSTSNSSGVLESTSLRPFTRWSFCNNNQRINKQQQHLPQRAHTPTAGNGMGNGLGEDDMLNSPIVGGMSSRPLHRSPYNNPNVNSRRWVMTTNT